MVFDWGLVAKSIPLLATGLAMTDVAIARDGFGAVWIVYGDSKATWLERRICP